MRELLHRLTFLFRRSQFDRELEDELRFHLETRTDELAAAGTPRPQALAQARREFGNAAHAREDTRAAWQFRFLEDLAGDLRYAARACRRNPAFTLAAVGCLALGIGANTTMFSIASEVLFSEPSVRDPASLLHIRVGGNSHSPLNVYRFLRDAGVFTGVGGENEEQECNWRHGDSVDRLFVVRVTDDFFDVTGFPVRMGRPIQPGESASVVVTHQFWQQRLDADPDAIGRKMILDGKVYTVAGVLPPDHRTVTGFGYAPDLYLPVEDPHAIVALFARMPPGMTVGLAWQRLKAVCAELDREQPDGNHKWANDITLSATGGLARIAQEQMLSSVAAFFAVLMLVVGLVLAIACANVASLLLARAAARSHEIAIRLSIGAGRGRILRQLLTESLLLALCGTAAGLALNIALTRFLGRYTLPLPLPLRFVIRPDWRLISYSAALALGTTLICGLMPALQATRAAIGVALKREERHSGAGRWSMRNLLVAGQLAVSIVLLSASFLFLRNMLGAAAMSPGFDLDRTAWASVRLVPSSYPDAARIAAFVEPALDRLRETPGIEAASIASVVPLNGNRINGTLVQTDVGGPPRHVLFHSNTVGPDYFRAMGIPILRGREFQRSDRPGAPPVVIVNENLARKLFGEIDPVGHTVTADFGKLQIVGVVANSKYFTLGEEGALASYRPYAQSPPGEATLNFLVRTAPRPEALIPAVRDTLGSLDHTAALEIKPLRNALGFALLPSRAGAALLGATGLLGLALASVGLYGTLLYTVSRRTREIGLRVALGAAPADVLRLVVRHALTLLAAGLAAGTGLAVFAVRPLAVFLAPGVRPADPWNFAAVGGALCLVALAASVAPAVRAMRVDPAVSLRHE
ncbi:MAG TPA: ADOP family duplicated permease [Bryobacteraceae bacterium]